MNVWSTGPKEAALTSSSRDHQHCVIRTFGCHSRRGASSTYSTQVELPDHLPLHVKAATLSHMVGGLKKSLNSKSSFHQQRNWTSREVGLLKFTQWAPPAPGAGTIYHFTPTLITSLHFAPHQAGPLGGIAFTRVLVLALTYACNRTLGKLLIFSVLQFLYLQNGDNINLISCD